MMLSMRRSSILQVRPTLKLSPCRLDRRTIVTADLDYPRLLAAMQSVEPSFFRGGSWSEADVRSRMAVLLANFSVADIESSILVVDRNRVRRRPLPVP
jgi:hypothetical protein